MKSRFILCLIAIVALLSGCSNTNRVTTISLDFPHGGLRLLARREGDTKLFYGALPISRTLNSGTFDIDDLYQQLETRLNDVVSAENRPVGQPYGMVTLEFSDGSEKDYLIYDQAFAVELFKIACANTQDKDDSGTEIFTTQCASLNGGTP